VSDPRVLIVSPVRDEAAHLERVVAGVVGQTRRPDRWVIVDDGSTDGTAELLERLTAEHDWIEVVRTPADFTAGGKGTDRLAKAAAPRAWNFGLRAAGGAEPWTHVGKLDGDTELRPAYLAGLLAHFAADPELGCAGGIRLEPDERGGWYEIPIPREHVPGALKLYTRECFTAIGGMRELLGWDAIDEITARMHGLRTQHFPELETLHHRPWGTADGRLRGRVRYGHASYVARQSPSWILLKSFKVAKMPPVGLSGLAFAYGYARAVVKRADRVEDPEFARFVHAELRARMVGALRRGRRAQPAAG
jgi:poly-beta-1,6-N-acetyl-D-glucosamine synthase